MSGNATGGALCPERPLTIVRGTVWFEIRYKMLELVVEDGFDLFGHLVFGVCLEELLVDRLGFGAIVGHEVGRGHVKVHAG